MLITVDHTVSIHSHVLLKLCLCDVYSKSITDTQTSSSEEQVKRRSKSKQEAFWDTAPVYKSLGSQTVFALELKTYCISSTTQSFRFQTVTLYKIKHCLFNLGTVGVWVMWRTWHVTHEFLDFVFSSCTLPIMQEPLGEEELLVNQSLMSKA